MKGQLPGKFVATYGAPASAMALRKGSITVDEFPGEMSVRDVSRETRIAVVESKWADT